MRIKSFLVTVILTMFVSCGNIEDVTSSMELERGDRQKTEVIITNLSDLKVKSSEFKRIVAEVSSQGKQSLKNGYSYIPLDMTIMKGDEIIKDYNNEPIPEVDVYTYKLGYAGANSYGAIGEEVKYGEVYYDKRGGDIIRDYQNIEDVLIKVESYKDDLKFRTEEGIISLSHISDKKWSVISSRMDIDSREIAVDLVLDNNDVVSIPYEKPYISIGVNDIYLNLYKLSKYKEKLNSNLVDTIVLKYENIEHSIPLPKNRRDYFKQFVNL